MPFPGNGSNRHIPAVYSPAALEKAARRGIDVEIVMTAESAEWDSAFSALVKAGAPHGASPHGRPRPALE
jgi:hypothetical protein